MTNTVQGILEQAAMYYIELQGRNDSYMLGLLDGMINTVACMTDKTQYEVFSEVKRLSEMEF